MDDNTPWLWFGEGPTEAWQEAVDAGRILHTQYFRDGEPVNEVTSPAAHAGAEGR
ncbi:MAG: hypothetical protein WBC54_13535 [Rhodococcus sp. (in: high G+C Gram-positive bacteria)]|uniref:hypothetical protein n=1 Tax=Rhodococcus sp. SBT000017 TaxID=1803385 RepID=UPI0016052343|nr:hypothetical protein [Rhodococcus sp. SBT000017]